MRKFVQNTMGMTAMLSCLFLDMLAWLYGARLVLSLSGTDRIVGAALLLAWIVFVFVDDVRLLLYYRRKVCITAEGISVGRGKRRREVRWEDVREAQVRDAVGLSTYWYRFRMNGHYVFSDRVLPDAVLDLICSDLDPWLTNEGYIALKRSEVDADAELLAYLRKKCPLLDSAAEQYVRFSISCVSTEGARLDNGKLFRKRIERASAYTFLLAFREVLWWFSAIFTQIVLVHPGPDGFQFPVVLWSVTAAATLGCLLCRRLLLRACRKAE